MQKLCQSVWMVEWNGKEIFYGQYLVGIKDYTWDQLTVNTWKTP
jgi:hypothetical protein